jgi:hypothetical protein
LLVKAGVKDPELYMYVGKNAKEEILILEKARLNGRWDESSCEKIHIDKLRGWPA